MCIEKLRMDLALSPTSYHVVHTASQQLLKNGFSQLRHSKRWNLKPGHSYFVSVDGSALIAFKIGAGAGCAGSEVGANAGCAGGAAGANAGCAGGNEVPHYSFNIVASHTDSPCFKLKHGSTVSDPNYKRLAIEEYGKSLQYTWFDRPLFVAGRVIVREKDTALLRSVLVRDQHLFVIPSLAIHLNREANSQLKLNIRKDIVPLIGHADGKDYVASLLDDPSLEICDFDLFLCSGETSFFAGQANEFLCAPRLDNQTSAFASIEALISAQPKSVAICFLADNEEVGSRTKQGAGATILKDVIARINHALGYDDEQLRIALNDSFMCSCDNSHAAHPNYPELADECNRNYLNKGIVIKHHANQSYTSDAVSSTIIKQICNAAGVQYQDFYNRSDLPSGGTLGAISSSQLSIRCVDIGLPQLGMHSSVETMGTKDYPNMIKALTHFFNTPIAHSDDTIKLL